MEKPSVLIYVYSPDITAINEMIAGAEEEGFALATTEDEEYDGVLTDDVSPERLSLKAAKSGAFGVGIGIVGKTAAMSVRVGKTPIFRLQDATAAEYRRMAQNAGRYIKKEPLLVD